MYWCLIALLGGVGCIDLASLNFPDAGTLAGAGGAPSPGTGGTAFSALSGTGGMRVDAQAVPAGAPVSVEIRDLDGDGVLEVIVVDNVTGRTTVFESIEGQQVAEPPSSPVFRRLVSRDLDGDGSIDLAFVAGRAGGSMAVSVIMNDRLAGRFQSPVEYDLDGSPAIAPSLVALDVDGDGRLDLQVSGDVVLDLLMNEGSGSFKVERLRGSPSSSCLGCLFLPPQPGTMGPASH